MMEATGRSASVNSSIVYFSDTLSFVISDCAIANALILFFSNECGELPSTNFGCAFSHLLMAEATVCRASLTSSFVNLPMIVHLKC